MALPAEPLPPIDRYRSWLHAILGCNVQNALRDLRRAKRDVTKEQPLEPATGLLSSLEETT